MLNGLDLFSGIGGITKALEQWVRPVAYCEIDRYAQSVLLSRMGDGQLPNAPIWDDVTTLGRLQFDVPVDIITGGFPCQDISVAGAGSGLAGERSGLFFEIARLCRELKPRFVFLENVPAITTRGGVEVVGTLAAMGYDCRWCVISAASVGANHKRDRWFLLANALCEGLEGQREITIGKKPEQRIATDESWWAVEPRVCNVSDGLSKRVDSSEPTLYNGEKEVIENALTPKTNSRKILPQLWREDGTFTLQWQAGRYSHFYQEGILWPILYGKEYDQRGCESLGNSKEDSGLLKNLLRELRDWRKSSYSSQGRELEEQRSFQFHDAVRFVSHIITSRARGFSGKETETAMLCLREVVLSTWALQYPSDSIEEAWQSLHSKEQDWSIGAVFFGRWWAEWPNVSRVSEKRVPQRVDRIKCLGNAVVPLQARQAFKILMGLEG